MSKIQLDLEFVKLLLGIYGERDSELDGKTIKWLYQIWKNNPALLLNTYLLKQLQSQKNNNFKPLNTPLPGLYTSPTLPQLSSLSTVKLDYIQPPNNTAVKYSQSVPPTEKMSRIDMPISHWKTMTDKGFSWDSRKLMWNNPKNSLKTTNRIISPTHWKDMTSKGFSWDSKKQVWINPQKPDIVSTETPRNTMSVEHWKNMINKGFSWDSRKLMWTKGRPSNKMLQGGKLEDNEKAFVAYLILISGAKSELELTEFILSLGEEGLKQQYQQFISVMQNGTLSAKNGTKLNYIKSLRGNCPEGYELDYFKEGGQICAKCVEKREKMGGIPFKPMSGEKGTKVVQDFKKDLKNKKDKITMNSRKKTDKKENGGVLLNIDENMLDFFKCGGKAKKSKKKEKGGLVEKNNRIPIKEKFIDKDKCGKKMKKK